MRFWTLPLMSLVYFLNSGALAASVRYECITEGVPLFTSESRQISDQRDNEVVYTAGPDVNANVVLGDNHFLIWYKEAAVAVLIKGQEGMLLHRVIPFENNRLHIKLQMIYFGETRRIRCDVYKI